jgi:hypothetical protein
MAETAPVAYVHAYSRELRELMQQRTSKLRSAVSVETGVEGKSYNFERLGASDLQTIVSRHAATPILNPVHSRRRVTFTDKGGAILLDPQDQLKMLIEPKNKYARNHAASVGRFFDDIIIAALTGSSTSVDDADATSAVTLASWDSGSHVIASGTTGLTFEKVSQVVRVLNEDEVPQEDRYFVISPQGIEDLLAEVEVTSSDYSTLNALKTGMLPADALWMGFKWIMSNRLSIDGSLDRSCVAFHKSCVGLAVAQDIDVRIDQRSDLSYAWQVFASVSAGATRIEEAGVVECKIREVA